MLHRMGPKKLLILVVALSTARVEGQDDKIQNGTRADSLMYPFVGSMQQPEKPTVRHFCMTNLVSTQWAITAAHCVVVDIDCLPMEIQDFPAHNIYIIMGATDLSRPGPNAQERGIMKGVVHPQYTYNSPLPFKHRYDLGAVQVDKPFVLSAEVNLVPRFPPQTAYNRAIDRMKDGHVLARIVGWGATVKTSRSRAKNRIILVTSFHSNHSCTDKMKYSPILLLGRCDLVTHSECCKNTQFKDSCLRHIGNTGYDCCIPVGTNSSTAQGDSGAPVVCQWHVNNVDIVVGIHQGGITVEKPGFLVTKPSFLVKYEVMSDFIDKLIGGRPPIHRDLKGGACFCKQAFSLYFTFSHLVLWHN